MKKASLFALATVLGTFAAAPAFADYDQIGTISVSYQQDRDSASPDFGGPVERLQFTARGSDIVCRNITATFRNGRTMSLFSGTLNQGSPRSVDLPGASQDVRRINTNCHADRRSGGTIAITADIGRYRDTWRNSPDWSRMWARMFNWGSNMGNSMDRNTTYSVTIAQLTFNRKDSTDSTGAGWSGRSVHSLSLRASNDDAYCDRMTVRFSDNGTTRDLNLPNHRIPQGRSIEVPLPGFSDRDVRSITLRCRPMSEKGVRVTISGNK